MKRKNIFKKYKKLRKLIDKEPVWISWFVGFLGFIYFFPAIYSLFTFPAEFIISVIISFLSASICLDLAKKNKGYPTLAFGIGFFLSLLGLLLYWLGQKLDNLED